MKSLQTLLLTLLVCILGSCAPSTPKARIAESPLEFEKLSEQHQKLVEQGKIERGMNMSAVALAWGKPTRRTEGAKGNLNTARWEYVDNRPVFSQQSYFPFQPFAHGPFFNDGFFLNSQQVFYVPYVKSAVWFLNGRVEEWESVRSSANHHP